MDVNDMAKGLRWTSHETRKALIAFHNIVDALVEYEGPDLHWYLAKQLTIVGEVVFVEGFANELFTAGYLDLCRIEGKLVVPDFCGRRGSSLHEVVCWGSFEITGFLGDLVQADPPEGWQDRDDDLEAEWKMIVKKFFPALRDEWREAAEQLENTDWYARLEMELVQTIRIADSYPRESRSGPPDATDEAAKADRGVEQLIHTRRFKPPLCKSCGDVRMRVTTSGTKGSRTRHLKCPKCGNTAKVTRSAPTS